MVEIQPVFAPEEENCVLFEITVELLLNSGVF